MTQEQYNRAVEISERLYELEKVKKEIANTSGHKLSYLYERGDGTYGPCSKYIMDYIDILLDRHDEMIRVEIDVEIEMLKKEIEEL